MQEAELLVLDEPTAALDYGNEVRVLHLIQDLGRIGCTIMMSTHQPDHALRCGDRAVLLQDGWVIADGPPAGVVTSDLLTRLYQVQVHVLATPLHDADGRQMYTCLAVRTTESGAVPGPAAGQA